MAQRYKVLCYLDFDKGRDIEILMPVVYYIGKYLNADVKFVYIFDLHLIYKEKPQAVLIANAIGSKLHHLVVKYASQSNIPAFALISEGNFRTDGSFDYWGYNTDKKIYQEFVCHWSKRTLDFLSEKIPEAKHKMVLTGATGFDRYKICRFATRDEFFKRHDLKNYNKVITYFGWAFGKLYNAPGLVEIRSLFADGNAEERIKWLEQQMLMVEGVLRQAIENNPDTLFILKRHPNEKHPHLTQPDKNEMVNLAHYPNVMYIVQENVHDLISVSDLVLGFETTTAMETWCMKTNPTILINPETEFKRDKLYLGSHIVKDYTELQQTIDEYYKTGTVSAFNSPEKAARRKKLLQDTIGFDDGFNHVRAGYYFAKTLEKVKQDYIPTVRWKFKYWRWNFVMHLTSPLYIKNLYLKLPKFRKTVWVFDNIKLKNVPVLKMEYFGHLDAFHSRYNIAQKIKNEEFWKEILSKEVTDVQQW